MFREVVKVSKKNLEDMAAEHGYESALDMLLSTRTPLEDLFHNPLYWVYILKPREQFVVGPISIRDVVLAAELKEALVFELFQEKTPGLYSPSLTTETLAVTSAGGCWIYGERFQDTRFTGKSEDERIADQFKTYERDEE